MSQDNIMANNCLVRIKKGAKYCHNNYINAEHKVLEFTKRERKCQ